MENLVGVINPYALGELVAEKNIKWASVQEPKKMLAEILNLDEDEIFDIKNPILSPGTLIQEDGKITKLSETEANTRLEKFYTTRVSRTSTTKLTAGLKIPAAATKLKEILFSSPEMTVQTGTPWAPTDKEWFDKGDFFEDVAELNDPIQGALGDCYFIAALSSVAWARPYAIVNATRPSAYGNDESPLHRVAFYKDGKGTAQTVEVSERVPVVKNSRSWVYARSLDPTEIWPAVMEKAYAKWRTGNTTDFPNYLPLAGGDPVMACAQLISGTTTYKNHTSTSETDLVSFVRSNSLGGCTKNPMVAWTYASQPSGTNYASANVVANHAYSVLGWKYYNNQYYVVLRNPWGTHHATLDTLAGTWTSSPQSISSYATYTANIPLNTNGLFAMKFSTYKKYFAGTGVAK